ncbi:MAG: glycosyltransferase [Acidobacteria bacterium]|nr:glycosyltransferase [Acidobacteriota bacterium]
MSDYAAELLPELGRLARVRVLRAPDGASPGAAPEITGCALVDSSTKPEPGEIALIHLGNNPYHEWLLPRLEDPACVVVLHDLVLHHILVESTLARGDLASYEQLMRETYGDRGAALAAARRFGDTGHRDPFLFPARRPFLRSVRAAIVHSSWAADQLRTESPELPVGVLPMPVLDPGWPIERRAVRERFGVAENEILLMHLGFLTREKGIEDILAALAVLQGLGVPARLLLVGEGRRSAEIEKVASLVGVGSYVASTGWVPEDEFPSVAAAADLGIALRKPSAGETSAAVLRFLACGTPAVVCGLRQFLEWPLEAVERITPGPATTAELVRVVKKVSAERGTEAGRSRREAARVAYADQHRPPDVAQKLVSLLEELAT